MQLRSFSLPAPTIGTYYRVLCAFVIGVALLQSQAQLLPWWALILGASLSAITLKLKPSVCRISAQIALFSLIGMAWAQWHAQTRLAQRLPVELYGQIADLEGQIVSIAQPTQFGQRFILQPTQAISALQWWPDQIQITVNDKTKRFQVGDRWRFQAKLRPVRGQVNPSSFDLESWFLQHNIAALATARQFQLLTSQAQTQLDWRVQLEVWRSHLLAKIERQLGEHPYAGIIKALAIGEQSQISSEQWWRFSQTGVTHLVSISGLHITMLASLVAGLTHLIWQGCPRLINLISAPKAAILAGVCAASAYFAISGMAIPSQRTIIMLSIFSIALWHHRKVPISLVWLLAISAVVVVDPFAVLSIGFWLSFLCVGFLLWVCANRVQAISWWRAWLLSQWGISLGLLPLLFAIFGQFPLVSPIANAFAIPLISLLITPLALLGVIEPTGQLLWLAAELMAWCDYALAWCLQLPLATWQHPPPPLWMLPTALIGVLLVLLPVGFAARYLGWLLLCPTLLFRPEPLQTGQFRAVVLDVGQGLAVLVQTQNYALLFDTGTIGNAERVILPSLRHFDLAKLDSLVLSHNDNDHMGGAQILLQRWPIEHVRHSLPSEHSIFQDVSAPRSSQNCLAGQYWHKDAVKFQILWPPPDYHPDNDNAKSCVLRISTPQHSLLITADISKREEAMLLARGQLAPSEVLIAPHHGSKSASSQDMINAVSPKYAVFSAGFMNRFGHPRSEVLERYRSAGAQTLITSHSGALHFDFKSPLQINSQRQMAPRYWYTTPHQPD
jgi:competence protein ComEC